MYSGVHQNVSTMNEVVPRQSSVDDDDYYYDDEYFGQLANNAWDDEPFDWGVVVYSIVIPIICLCGILGNTAILFVLQRRSLKESTYTYLTVLAAADLVTCLLLLFSGLARGLFWKQDGWMEFDVFIYIPLGTISSNVTVLAAIGVAIDRLVIVVGPVRCRQPSFCSKTIARRFMGLCVLVVVLFDMPFFFIYTYDNNGFIVTKQRSDAYIFAVLNWMQLVLFGLLPAIFLLICNVVMILAVRRTLKHREMLKCRQTRVEKYLRDQSKLTITLVGIVFLFLIGEIPTHLASRRSAISILYGGDPHNVDKSVMKVFRLIATVLNAVSSSANFVMYCLLNPRFLMNLKALFRRDDKSNDRLMRIATIKATQLSDTTASHMSCVKDDPCKF